MGHQCNIRRVEEWQTWKDTSGGRKMVKRKGKRVMEIKRSSHKGKYGTEMVGW